MRSSELKAFYCLFAAVSLNLTSGVAQPSEIDPYKFIQYDKNVLVFPGDSTVFVSFFEKMQTLLTTDEGNVNVMHIGGSHVQAGTWTNGLCQSLRVRLPGLSVTRGLIFPYKAVGSTQPSDYTVSYSGRWQKQKKGEENADQQLGLMGITATTSDSNAYLKITAWGAGGALMKFRSVKIFHAESPTSYALSFPGDSLAIVSRDSISGFTLVDFSKEMDTLHLQLNETSPEQHVFSLQGIRLDPCQPGLCFDAIGNNGADLPSYLRCTYFTEQLQAVVPDLVILSVGINDAYTRQFNAEQFKKNYRTLIAKIRSGSPECAILFTTNNDSYYRRRYPNGNGVKVQQAMFELAAECDGGVWDLYTVMGGSRSINQWVSARLAQSDRIHFTRNGYLLLGGLLSDAIVDAFMDFHRQQQPGD